jgi:Tfp pilus assembly protein PilF
MKDSAASSALELFHLGELHLEAGEIALAAGAFNEALKLQPGWAEAHANLGYACDLQGNAADAEACYRTAIALQPENFTVHLNLGALLAVQKRHTEAEASYAIALALDAESSAVWSNLGALNLNLQREDRAEACLRHAMELDPTNARARVNLAYLQLRRGNFEEGWELFESREVTHPLIPQADCPRWHGEPLQGKSLLVVCERGHGDAIQFCRYLPWLRSLGPRHITLLCHPVLKTLLQTLQAADTVHAFDEPLDRHAHDLWMPLLSAPYRAQTRADSIPTALPYLQADSARSALWATLLPVSGDLRVGLVWKGNPQFENDRDRSLPNLRALEPLWSIPGVQFISMQKADEASPASLTPANMPLLDLGEGLRDFADAAAIVDQFDLLICVDTAMAHLAGALGKPCWVLLPWYMPDWRWGAEGSQSPWYPIEMRLFRQTSDGDWDGVVRELQSALLARAAGQ